MAHDKPFLVPVVIDDTAETDARVPEKFGEVQWTRLPCGETTDEFVGRVDRLLRSGPDLGSPGPAAGSKSHSALPLSIVVLPFANFTGDPAQSYVADGFTASLTADLSRLRSAFIVDATTAFKYKGRSVTAQQVGRELGVRFVLEGNIQRSNDTVRINAQLADATSSAALWSESFTGDQANLFALQDQVTSRIGNSIAREMLVVAARESETRRKSPTVVDLMLRLRALALKARSLRNLEDMESLAREILKLEPDNMLGAGALANVLVLQATNFGSAWEDSVRDKKFAEGRDIALKARDLDPDNPGAYVALSFYALSHDDYAGARHAAETALALQPNRPVSYNNLAAVLLHCGEPAPALDLLRKAIALDPGHPSDVLEYNTGRAHFMLGEHEAAITWLRRAIDRNPGDATRHAYLTLAYLAMDNDAKARDALAELRNVDPKFEFMSLHAPTPSSPAAYKDYWTCRVLPAARKAERSGPAGFDAR